MELETFLSDEFNLNLIEKYMEDSNIVNGYLTKKQLAQLGMDIAKEYNRLDFVEILENTLKQIDSVSEKDCVEMG